jgi:hypothetical protein
MCGHKTEANGCVALGCVKCHTEFADCIAGSETERETKISHLAPWCFPSSDQDDRGEKSPFELEATFGAKCIDPYQT